MAGAGSGAASGCWAPIRSTEGRWGPGLSAGVPARLYFASAPEWRNGRRSGLKIRRP